MVALPDSEGVPRDAEVEMAQLSTLMHPAGMVNPVGTPPAPNVSWDCCPSTPRAPATLKSPGFMKPKSSAVSFVARIELLPELVLVSAAM